jgi:hypothetical protein
MSLYFAIVSNRHKGVRAVQSGHYSCPVDHYSTACGKAAHKGGPYAMQMNYVGIEAPEYAPQVENRANHPARPLHGVIQSDDIDAKITECPVGFTIHQAYKSDIDSVLLEIAAQFIHMVFHPTVHGASDHLDNPQRPTLSASHKCLSDSDILKQVPSF